MCRKHTIFVLMTLCLSTAAWGLEASVEVNSPAMPVAPDAVVDVPVLISSPEQIGALRFTLEYSSAACSLISVTKGNAIPANWTRLVYPNVAGSNTTPGTDRNVMVRLIGSGLNFITGTDLQVAVIRFRMAPETCNQTPLGLSADCTRTALSTLQLITICDPTLLGDSLATDCPSDAPSPPGALLGLRNIPNPFNPSTMIVFELATGGLVQLRVFDIGGRMVRRLMESDLSSGRHEVLWNGRDDAGRALPGGVYLYQLMSSGESVSHRTVLLK